MDRHPALSAAVECDAHSGCVHERTACHQTAHTDSRTDRLAELLLVLRRESGGPAVIVKVSPAEAPERGDLRVRRDAGKRRLWESAAVGTPWSWRVGTEPVVRQSQTLRRFESLYSCSALAKRAGVAATGSRLEVPRRLARSEPQVNATAVSEKCDGGAPRI